MNFRMVKIADASDPRGVPTGVSVVAGYIGGDTPHVWQDRDWDKFPMYKKVPIFVRSQTVGATGGESDAFLALDALYRLKVPHQTVVVYDRETNTDKEATQAFGDVLHWARYYVMPYGSTGNLFEHPALDGYWVADPTNTPHMYNHPLVRMTQYEEQNGYDYSECKFWVVEQRMRAWA